MWETRRRSPKRSGTENRSPVNGNAEMQELMQKCRLSGARIYSNEYEPKNLSMF